MANIIATTCIICGHPLTDPLSVEIGIGPECRKGHGFEARDAESDWGCALQALGNDCPAELYDVVVDAHGSRKGHDEKEVDTTLADASKAIRGIGSGEKRRPGLCWYLATALDRPELTLEGVLRIVLAIRALGYRKLAAALTLGLYKRPDFRDRFQAVTAYVTRLEVPETVEVKRNKWSYTTEKVTFGFKVEASMSFAINSRLRAMGGRFVSVRRRKFWAMPATLDAKKLFEELMAAEGIDLVAGQKWVTDAQTGKRSLVCDVRSPVRFTNAAATKRAWWDEAFDEAGACCWADAETGNLVRYCIAGEPPCRPGLEKVPAEFYGHTLRTAKVAS